nr:tryptophan-rich sensory protein [Gemmatimonadaceae bacterium]
WRDGLLATIDVVVLLALVVATLVAYARHDRLAAALLVPYALWVSFATALTIAVWQRNPTLL